MGVVADGLCPRRLKQLEALTAAKIRGYAIGGGLQLALGCDLRIAAPDARLGLPAVLEALIPGTGTFRLPQFISLGRARRMVLTGELVSAEEALRTGRVDWVVPEEKLDATINSLIAQILKGGATARGFSKKLATSAWGAGYEEAFSTCLEYQQRTLLSDDHRQAMAEYRNRKR